MNLVELYQCFCDETRLRILHLLSQGPLCVCHFQAILGETQVKVSKHLAYLKEKEVVWANRHQNWMIYCLREETDRELELNLRCLQDCVAMEPVFKADLQALKALKRDVAWIKTALDCCRPDGLPKSAKNTRKARLAA